MKYGLHFGCWADTYEEASLHAHIRRAHAAGADAFEFGIPGFALRREKKEIDRMLNAAAECNVELLFTTLYPENADPCSPDAGERARAAAYMSSVILGAADCGVKSVNCIPYGIWPYRFDNDSIDACAKRERKQRGIETMKKVMPVAEDAGVAVNCEVLNRFEGLLINTVEEGLDFCAQVDSRNCCLLLDVFHMNIEEDDMYAAIVAAGQKGKLGHLHVSEPTRKVPHTDARVDWKRLAQALHQARYDGPVVIESFLVFCGERTYATRLWRDFVKDHSPECRDELLSEGLRFLRDRFSALPA